MKTRDLMIGDWVYRVDFNAPVPSKIIGIEVANYDEMEYIVDILNKNEHNVHLYLNEIEPIPLSTEILEKNGFKKDEKQEEMYYWNWGIGNNCVSYDKETGIVRIFHVFGHLVFVLPLSYVHQLQHALRLCGIDKEIEL